MWHLLTTYYIESIATLATVPAILSFVYRKALLTRALRYFFAYLLVKLIIELIMFYMASKRMENLFLANTLTIAGFFLFARMFQETYESSMRRRMVSIFEFVFIVVVSIDMVRDGMYYTFRYSGMAECIFVMIFCLSYFYELIRHPTIPYLLAYPFFWVCSGMLIYFSCCVIISPLAFYLDRWPENKDMHVFIILPYIMETAYLTIISLGIFTIKK